MPITFARGRWQKLAMPLVAVLTVAAWASAQAAQPEFGGYCAEGLVQHHLIKTDCKINWTSKDGKLYCFSNAGAKVDFIKAPDGEHCARDRQLRRKHNRTDRRRDGQIYVR